MCNLAHVLSHSLVLTYTNFLICLYYNAISTHSILIVVVFHGLRTIHIVSLACVHFSANVLLIHVQSVFFIRLVFMIMTLLHVLLYHIKAAEYVPPLHRVHVCKFYACTMDSQGLPSESQKGSYL